MNVSNERTMGRDQPEVGLLGRGIAPGLGMGKAWVVGDVLKGSGAPAAISPNDVEHELVRLKQAVEETLAELERSALRIEFEFDAALAGIFRAHGLILQDLFASGEIERELRTSLLTAETAVRRVFRGRYQQFEALENQTLRERADDVLDLGRNVIRRLRGIEDTGLQSIPEHSVLVIERLLPSDVVRLPKANVTAVAVESLGQGSHAALLAREKGIPTITEIPGILSRVTNGTELLVDGYDGKLIIAPQSRTRAEFQKRMEKWQTTLKRCKGACREPANSLDGHLIRVEANIGIQDDVELALDNGADGVGLLRIEQLYFARNTPPSEAELFAELKRLVTPLRDRPVTIRLLDIGGDKPLPYLRLPATPNPVLGRRGVRVLLEYTQLVRTQMGAILRLSQEHPVRVLIPMVTLEEDVEKMREAFDALSAERKISRPPEFGAMVETPAAALAIPALLKHVDFLCVGTNDLAQYTLAAARDDATVNDYYLDSHESILRLLRIILADAKQQSVTLCGELAGRETWLPRLLQMGFRTLSVAPTLIPTTKATIRGVDIGALGTTAIDNRGS
jgi:phosphoenolpyruvate-protein phosphotransferase